MNLQDLNRQVEANIIIIQLMLQEVGLWGH